MSVKRVDVLGVPVDCVDMESALSRVEKIIAGNKPQTVLAVNPEKVMFARENDMIMRSLKNAGLLIPDGIGVVLAVSLLKREYISGVPGADLMPAICSLSAKKGYRIFLYGASPKVNEKTVKFIREKYAGIQISGFQHGYIDDANMDHLIHKINASKTDVLFVALGSPRQELWMAQYLGQLNIKVCQGVGGTFDVISGEVKRAPLIFRKAHLEWFYRLMAQPKRLFRQTALPRFAWLVFKEWLMRGPRKAS